MILGTLLTLASMPTAASPQERGASVGALVVAGDVKTPLSISPTELRNWPRTRVEVKEGDHTVVYEGVLVGEILKRAGAQLGAELRDGGVATYVIASAPDGYQVLFSLGELDPDLTNSGIIVADTVDGQPLGAKQGPLRIVAPKETRGARWIRQLEGLQVVRVRK